MSLRAIARQLGVSSTTVSLALRDSPRISTALTERIKKRARALGYVPNARLAEMMSEVRQAQPVAYRATIGLISLYPEERPWSQRPTFEHLKLVINGSRERAEQHGYKLEEFWVKRPGQTLERLRTILDARGIKGLLCLGSADPDEMFPEPLRKFAVVTHAASIPDRLHRVLSHFAADANLLLVELSRRGYHRPGLAMLGNGDRRTGFVYSAMMVGYHERKLSGTPLPILRAETWNEAEFSRWFDANRPDVIVLHQYPPYIAGVEAWLSKRRLRVPRDVGIALLDKNPDPARYSGICQNPWLMGAVALEMLIGRLMLRDFGPPDHPKVELVEGSWNEGATLRPGPPAGSV